MTLLDDILAINPVSLTSSTFLVNLALAFNVRSIPLALFILFCVCVLSGLLLIFIIWLLRIQLARKFVRKRRANHLDGVYVDEIPGGVDRDAASLEYTLEYDVVNSTLKVGLNQANKLNLITNTPTVNAFAIVSLFRLVSRKKQALGKKLETKPLCRSEHHCWQRMLINVIKQPELTNISILFEVLDKDTLGHSYQCIGRLEVFLKKIDFRTYAGQMYERFGWLQPGDGMKKVDGELCIGLGYDIMKSEIDVIIYEARYLKLPIEVTPNPMSHWCISVLIELLHGKKLVRKQEVRCKQVSTNPYFNSKVNFKIQSKCVNEYQIICLVRRCSRFGRKYKLGTVQLGHKTTPAGLCHWDRMISCPYSIHGMWQPLVPTVKRSAIDEKKVGST